MIEEEIKIRLKTVYDYEKVQACLFDRFLGEVIQRNVYFDGKGGELSNNQAIFRLRFLNNDLRCVATLKSGRNGPISGGISQLCEEEETIDVALGKDIVSNPSLLNNSDLFERYQILRSVFERFRASEYVNLGSVTNVRNIYRWDDGLKIELDHTTYDFGELYEIEMEFDSSILDGSKIKLKLFVDIDC